MAEKEPGTAVAAPSNGGPLDFGGLALTVFSTFGPADKARVVQLMQGQAEPLSEMIGETITVEHILAHTVETISDDGEALALLRIVLVDKDGKAYATTSEGVRESVRLIANYYGSPPWLDGLALKVESIKTRRGFRTFRLSPA